MKSELPRKKLSTDELVKNLFDPLQKTAKTETVTETPRPAPDDVFFETATKPRVERRVKAEPLPPLTEEEKELRRKFEKRAFNPAVWTFAASVLFLTAYFVTATYEWNDKNAQVVSYLNAQQEQITRYEKALGVKTAEAERVRSMTEARMEERRELLRQQIFLRKNLRRGRSHAVLMAGLTQSLPPTVRLEKISISNNSLIIEGVTSNANDAGNWVDQLKANGLIRNQALSRNEIQNLSSLNLVEFTVHADLVS